MGSVKSQHIKFFLKYRFSPQFPRKSCWVQQGTRLPGNHSYSRSRELLKKKKEIKEWCLTMQEINQQPFVNRFGFSCAGPGDFLPGKGKRSQTPQSADKAALFCLNSGILSTKAPLMLHFRSSHLFLFRYPQIILQIRAIIPCAS